MTTNVKTASNFGTKNRAEALRLQLMATDMALRVGANIRNAREEMGLKQRQLADLIPSDAIDNQRISDWERGVNQPSPRNMEALAAALGKDEGWFYIDHEEPAPTPDPFKTDDLEALHRKVDQLANKLDVLLSALGLGSEEPDEVQEAIAALQDLGAGLLALTEAPDPDNPSSAVAVGSAHQRALKR